jgi:hypothetical protein
MTKFQVGDLVKRAYNGWADGVKSGTIGIVTGEALFRRGWVGEGAPVHVFYPVYWFHLNQTQRSPVRVIRKLEVKGE